MAMIREISGRLYSVRKQAGRQHSQPIAEALAEARQQLDAARSRLAEATASYERLRDQLRVALAGGDWTKAKAMQQAVDQARRSEQEADAEIMRLTDQLSELEDAIVAQRVRQREQRFSTEMTDMLDRHPIPEPPPEAA